MRLDLLPELPDEPKTQKKVVLSSGGMGGPPKKVFTKGRPSGDAEDGKYQELLQNIYDAALISDTEGRIVDCNVRAMEFFQYERDEIVQLTIFDLINGLESHMETVQQNLENERYVLLTSAYALRKDGSYFIAEISVNKLQLNSLHHCWFIRDITLRKQTENMLLTEHNAIQNSGNGIAVTNVDGALEYFNPSVLSMWGYEALEQLMGQDVRILLGDPEVAKQIIDVVLGEGQPWAGETTGTRSDGSMFHVQVSAACNKNSDGEAVGMVFSFVDISDRKTAEDALREAERNRVMLESLGAACHHLGQPATVLLANLGLLQRRIDQQDPFVKDLVHSSIEAMETLGEILHRLNTVNEYKTTKYLENPEGSTTPESRILEI